MLNFKFNCAFLQWVNMELLPSYQELKSCFPLSLHQQSFIERSRSTIRQILDGQDPRLLMIVGPCSIHDTIAAKEFASQLKRLSLELSTHFFFVMRAYCEKARTSLGWKGLLYDPFLDGSNNLKVGLCRTRQFLLELADLEVPAATEFLDPLTAGYYEDLISWGSIGARTTSSQVHRQFASNLQMPVGIKNGTDGDLLSVVHSTLAVSHPHTYMSLSNTGQLIMTHSEGNPDTHVVLRGGRSGPNYDSQSIYEVLSHLRHAHLPQRLLIDCSHQNSGKRHDRQPAVLQTLLHYFKEGQRSIRGCLLESFLLAGHQPLINPKDLQYGLSITDACLSWETTEHLLRWAASYLENREMDDISSLDEQTSISESERFAVAFAKRLSTI